MNPARKTLLQDILSQPTAPFREAHVISRITRELEQFHVPYFQDPVGNLILGVSSQKEYTALLKKSGTEPLRIFVAHMDHPGFHGVRWKSPRELQIRWHGGSPTKHLDGAKVWIANSTAWVGHGTLLEPKLMASGKALESGVVRIDSFSDSSSKEDLLKNVHDLFGGFGFRAPYWNEGNLIYTKAADDLVGTFAVTSLALDFFGISNGVKNKSRTRSSKLQKKEVPFLGLLTRAEEVGFIGAIGHFELGWLNKAKRPVLCVSLETSRTLPGAEIGKGPVVRLGDKFTVFDPGALRVFTQLAQTTLPESHQRRVMDGGTCEATAATVFGIPSIGISVPLGNYHNQSFEGGPDAAPSNGPAPEFVHEHDIEGLLALCNGLIQPKLPWSNPWVGTLNEFRKNLRGYRSLLRTGI